MMGIVAFNFTKIVAEKKNVPQGSIDIKNNVKLIEIAKANLSLGTNKQTGLRFSFNYTSDYEPGFGNIILGGEVLYLLEEKKVEEAVKAWKAKKPVNEDLMNEVMNQLLEKCTVVALIMSREVGLPASIPLPKVGGQK